MCGLVGVITTEGALGSIERSKFFKNALIADAIRGPHSTGFFKVNAGTANFAPEVEIHKRAFHANDFLDLKSVDTALTNINSTNILIGHNRWATVGGIHHETAHPFKHGGVTMVHNGTLDYYDHLPGYKDFDVDSEVLTYAMSQTDDPKTVLEKLDGAYALVWYDERDHKLRTARNTDRPLHYAYEKKYNTLLMASEAGMLKWLADRHHFDIEDVWQLAPGKLVTFNLDDLRKYEVEDFEIYEPWYNNYKYNAALNTYDYEQDYGRPNNFPVPANQDDNSKVSEFRGGEVILNDLQLKKYGKFVFDADKFEYYNNDNAVNQYGKLVGTCKTPAGIEANVEINGLKAEDFEEMVGYSILADALSARLTTFAQGVPFYTIQGNNPKYIEEDDDLPFDKEEAGEIDRYGPFNTYIPNSRWLSLIEDGCAMCTGPIDPEDDDEVGWDSVGRPICKHCMAGNGWEGLNV